MRTKKETQKSAKNATVTGKAAKGFTDEERIAMKERAQELKAEARRGQRARKTDGEGDVLAKIAEMPEPDREHVTFPISLSRALASARFRLELLGALLHCDSFLV